MRKEVLENHKIYSQRLKFYQGFGYDLEKERDFILDQAMPISGKILEIGTGKGHFTLALAKRGFSFVSIDISAQEQTIARLNIEYFGFGDWVDFRVEDAERINFPNKSFDIIFSINVFHHLENPKAILGEINRLLKHGGKVVLGDFTEEGLEIINTCHTHEGRRHDYFKHGLEEAKAYFCENGFKISESQSKTQKVIIALR